MAEKPKMPNTDTGRRKRGEPPTIDLTATELPSASSAEASPAAAVPSPVTPEPSPLTAEPAPTTAEPPPPPEPPEPPETTAFSADPSGPDGPLSGAAKNHWFSGPALAGGIAGAILVTLVLFGLWLTGWVPIRYAGSTAMRARVTGLEMQLHDLQNRPAATMDTKAIEGLNERLNKIEAAVGKIPPGDPKAADGLDERLNKVEAAISKISPSDSSLTERISAADNTLKSVGVALAALGKRSDDAATNASQARERAEAAEKAVTDLRASLKDVAKDASAAVAPAELEGLQQRVDALEQSIKAAREDIAKTTASDKAARLALSAAALRNSVFTGAPFGSELAQVKSLGGDSKALAPLEIFAANGVPTQAALAQELRALLPGMVKVTGDQAPAGGFLDRLQANASKLVRVRPVDAPAGDDAAAVLARLDIAAAREDIAGALTDLARLPEATRAPAHAWIAKAQARQAALAAARTFADIAARALGSR